MVPIRFRGLVTAAFMSAGLSSVAFAQKGFDDPEMRNGPDMELSEKPEVKSAVAEPSKKGMCAINGVAPKTPNTAAISVVFDTSASMLDQGRGEEARKVLQLFARTASSKTDVALTTFQGACSAAVVHPLAPMSDDARRSFSRLVATAPFKSATPIVESVRQAAAQLDFSSAKQKAVFLVTDGDPTCLPEERANACAVFEGLHARGIQVVVLGYLLTPEMASAYTSCRNTITYYGIDSKTPPEIAARQLQRLLLRARRQFFIRQSDASLKSLYAMLDNTQCLDSKMPQKWVLRAESEYRLGNGQVGSTPEETPVEIHQHHLIQPQVSLGMQFAEVGAEDLYVRENGRMVSYAEKLADMMDACCDSVVPASTKQTMDHFEDDLGDLDAIRKKANPGKK
jgi:hypothetical protein